MKNLIVHIADMGRGQEFFQEVCDQKNRCGNPDEHLSFEDYYLSLFLFNELGREELISNVGVNLSFVRLIQEIEKI